MDYQVKGIPTLRKVKRMDFRHAPEIKEDGYKLERILPDLPAFYMERYLKRGFTLITDGKEPRKDKITCLKCGGIFWGGKEYEEHTCLAEPEEAKKEETLYTCEICGKEFQHPLALAGHKRTHEKTKKED